MQLYNTLGRKLEPFTPLNPKEVGLYSCGPTVYDHIHIGNLSAFIMADTLRRTLTANSYNVSHVMNFTDVDDKTIRRSQQEFPAEMPKEALTQLTEKYSKIFTEDMQAVGNDIREIVFTKATDSINITAMQRLIQELYKEGFAYIADDGVYFSIEKYESSGKIYGQLSHITRGQAQIARVHNDEYDKDAANDFALWKKQKDDEPSWGFTLDGHNLAGRPGWHIECSAMSRRMLGQPFDIHTGGIDLIFPHHENEIAQSTAGGRNTAYANYFVHNEHILVDGKKMSKSLGNFYTLEDVRAKGFDPLAFRLLVLQAHYRSQVHFSWENLAAAQTRLKRFRNFAVRQFQDAHTQTTTSFDPTVFKKYPDILGAINNDLDTPKALAAVEDYMAEVEQRNISDFLQILDSIFGLDLLKEKDIDDKEKELIKSLEVAREQQDWELATTIRDKQLRERGIGINNTPKGSIWYRL